MTGLIVAAAIIGLICLVGGIVLFLLLPIILAGMAFLALLLTMMVVAVVLVPNFVTLDSFKPQIAEAVQQSLGREISIGGPIGFSVWPVLGLQLKDISLGNPAGAEEPIMLSAKELGVGVTLSSLLDHKLELRELRLVGAQINLSVDNSGRGNWAFKPHRSGNDNSKDAVAPTGDKASLEIKDVQINRIEVVDGFLSYDGADGSAVDVEDVDVIFTMPSLDAGATLSGDLTFRGREVKLSGNVTEPRLLTSESGSAATLDLTLGSDEIHLDGKLRQQGMIGQMTGTVADLSALMGWATDNPTASLPFKTLSLQTALDVTSSRARLSDLALKLDDTTVSGAASARWDGARPSLTADLDVGLLKLDTFTESTSTTGADLPASDHSTEAAVPDLSGLNALNADVTAKLAGVVVRGLELGATTLKLTLENGKLQSSLSPASLHGGTVRAKLELTPPARHGAYSFASSLTLDGVNIDDVLTRMNGNSRLTGTADFTANVNGPVFGGNALMASLDGEGRFMVRDGAVKGVNIAAILRRAKSVLGNAAVTESDAAQQTDFTELSGTYRITDGVVRNDDLKMLSPLLRVSGKGTASLVSQSADYRIEAALVADLSGQGGVMQRRGFVVPIFVRGPFSALRYEPDMAGLALGNVDAARGAVDAIRTMNPRDVREGAKGALQNLLGGDPKPAAPASPAESGSITPTPAPTPAQDNPLNSLQNLLQR